MDMTRRLRCRRHHHHRREDAVRVDFAGTSSASRFGINCPLAYTTAYSVFGLSCALTPRVPNNAGSLSAYSVTAPAHTIANALPPATPVASRHIGIGQMLPDVVFGGLRQAIPRTAFQPRAPLASIS